MVFRVNFEAQMIFGFALFPVHDANHAPRNSLKFKLIFRFRKTKLLKA